MEKITRTYNYEEVENGCIVDDNGTKEVATIINELGCRCKWDNIRYLLGRYIHYDLDNYINSKLTNKVKITITLEGIE